MGTQHLHLKYSHRNLLFDSSTPSVKRTQLFFPSAHFMLQTGFDSARSDQLRLTMHERLDFWKKEDKEYLFCFTPLEIVFNIQTIL